MSEAERKFLEVHGLKKSFGRTIQIISCDP